MGQKLYVGNLPYTTTEQEITDLFAAKGTVSSTRLITDKFTGRSKGFAFVEMAEEAQATQAIETLNGSDLGGRKIIVSVARSPEERPRRGGGGGGGRRW